MEEACDMYHPDYGWLRVDDVTTKQGLKYFKDQRERYGAREESREYIDGLELSNDASYRQRNFN